MSRLQSLFLVFGRSVERRALLPGAAVSLGVALGAGVIGGSLVPERTAGAYVINAVLFAGLVAGGVVAARRATAHPMLAAVLTSVPVMALAVVVQLIRRFGPGTEVAPLGLPLVMLLAASLASLGGVLAGVARNRRPSLLERSRVGSRGKRGNPRRTT